MAVKLLYAKFVFKILLQLTIFIQVDLKDLGFHSFLYFFIHLTSTAVLTIYQAFFFLLVCRGKQDKKEAYSLGANALVIFFFSFTLSALCAGSGLAGRLCGHYWLELLCGGLGCLQHFSTGTVLPALLSACCLRVLKLSPTQNRDWASRLI